MTAVNLLPGEVRERQKSRRVTAAIVAGAGVAILLLGFVFMLQAARVSDAQHQLAQQQATNQHLQSEITGLQRYRDLKQQLADEQALVSSVTSGQVLWSGVLRDLSMVVPGDAWFTQLTASATAAPATAGVTASTTGGVADPDIVGSLQFQGSTLDQPSVATLLTRLEQPDGWENGWVSTSARAQNGLVNFTGSVDLTAAATSGGRK